MTQYTLFPSFVRIFYHSVFAPHTMTIPTLQWQAGAGQGEFITHNAGTVDADTMVNELVDQLAANYYGASDSFDNYVIYNYTIPDGPPNPVAGNTLAVAGSGTVSAYREDAQLTILWRTALFNIFKLTLMDAEPGANFKDDVTFGSPESLLHDIVTDPDNAFAGRDGTRPLTFVKVRKTINDRLHKRTT